MKVFFRRISVITVVVAAFFFAGCGKAPEYNLPVGKTMIYEVTEQPGQVMDGEEKYSIPMKTMQVHMRIKQRLNSRTAIKMTARPPSGRTDVRSGGELGKLDLKIEKFGKEVEAFGMGIPQETRFFVPDLPGRMKKGEIWTEKVKVMYKSHTLEFDLDHEYVGIENAANRKCYLVKGTGRYTFDERVLNQDMGVDATQEFIFDYQEDYYFDIGRGYIVKTEVFQKRKRMIVDNLTGNTEFDEVDMNRKTIELVAVED